MSINMSQCWMSINMSQCWISINMRLNVGCLLICVLVLDVYQDVSMLDVY